MDEKNSTTNQAQQVHVPPAQHMCPNCGYCPCCGRANARPYFAPYVWQPVTYPYWITWGGTPFQTQWGQSQQVQGMGGFTISNNLGPTLQTSGLMQSMSSNLQDATTTA